MKINIKDYKKFQRDDGYDGVTYLFEYELVKPGRGVEYNESSQNKFEVSVSRTLAKIWGYTEEELIKILFEFCRRVILFKLIEISLSKFERLELHTGNIGKEKPFDPNIIDDPKGLELEKISIRSEKIGNN